MVDYWVAQMRGSFVKGLTDIKLSLVILFPLVVLGCATNGQQAQENFQIDRISEAELALILPQPIATLSLDDLVKLAREGNNSDQIIEKIKMSNSYYDLTPSQSIELNKQGVDNKVLDYIHASRELALRNNVADEINNIEKRKRAEIEKLKRQQYFYDQFCGYGPYGFYPYGYGAYGSRYGSSFGLGFSRHWGCW
jgi:hypothetical protein